MLQSKCSEVSILLPFAHLTFWPITTCKQLENWRILLWIYILFNPIPVFLLPGRMQICSFVRKTWWVLSPAAMPGSSCTAETSTVCRMSYVSWPPTHASLEALKSGDAKWAAAFKEDWWSLPTSFYENTRNFWDSAGKFRKIYGRKSVGKGRNSAGNGRNYPELQSQQKDVS